VTRYGHALVIGKFYPPHSGHGVLVDRALAEAGRVTVVVMASGGESIPLRSRVTWLRKIHSGRPVSVTGVCCDAPLDLYDDRVWTAQVEAVRSALRIHASPPVDVVVSGESYGERLAGYFGAENIRVGRTPDGISATRIRSDLVRQWDHLHAATRGGLAVRVVVVGAESTGTTTLSKSLAELYRARGEAWARTRWVPEYGRQYTSVVWDRQRAAARAAGLPAPGINDVIWTRADFDAIGGAQNSLEDDLAEAGSPLLVCDTDALATVVWERRYLGALARRDPDWASPPALARRDLYLLTDHDGVPWEDDGLREGDLSVREEMTEWFADLLTVRQMPWVFVTGTAEQRLNMAAKALEAVLTRRLHLADPLRGPGFDH